MGFKLKPSSFKQTTRTETRQTVTNTGPTGEYKFVGKAGKRTDENRLRWYDEYLAGLNEFGLLPGFEDSNYSLPSNDPADRLKKIKWYIKKLAPEIQYKLKDFHKSTFYPADYKEWLKANPGTETTITEQRDITNTPGSPGYESKGGYDEVWGNMPLEEQEKYANKEEWIIEAEKWKEEQEAIAAKEEIGDWKETNRVTRST